jgi:hypothetical protein
VSKVLLLAQQQPLQAQLEDVPYPLLLLVLQQTEPLLLLLSLLPLLLETTKRLITSPPDAGQSRFSSRPLRNRLNLASL